MYLISLNENMLVVSYIILKFGMTTLKEIYINSEGEEKYSINFLNTTIK